MGMRIVINGEARDVPQDIAAGTDEAIEAWVRKQQKAAESSPSPEAGTNTEEETAGSSVDETTPRKRSSPKASRGGNE